MSTDQEMSGSAGALPSDLQPAVSLILQAIVAKHRLPAPLTAVEATITAMRPSVDLLFPEASGTEVYARIARAVMEQVSVEIAPPVVLAPDYEPWFAHAVTSGRVKLERWYSYKQFLAHDEGFAPQVLDQLDQSSGEVVDLLGDPSQSGSWKRRGLVIGDVQSGKTATYIGIVNKAADAGYKLVVLLTGGTESLRKQTQFRVDEGFLGKDSSVTAHDKVIGVGRHPTQTQFLRGQGMTTHAKDFVASSLTGQAVHIDPNADHPYVFVIKKNKTPLSNLITWLSSQFKEEQFDIPMLVVDDEADYASVNTNYRSTGDTSPTLINQKIRELLALTTRSSYMAFTATPFANVFIDHKTYDEALKDDLFPHQYILTLRSPSNYVGARKFFGTADVAAFTGLVDISDAHEVFPPKHKSQLVVPWLPASLEEAIRTFVVASAIRLVRDDETPRSMLINVSRFKNVQSQTFELVTHEFARLKNAIEIHAQPPVSGLDQHKVLLDLAEVFASQFGDVEVTWPQVRDKLFAAVFDTRVELINSSRDKTTDDQTRNMIAVGGDVLSRGLTLEGLTVSYFYRIVGAADTLLQMARWFGYRPGYEDLVRVWISPEVADQFRFVSDVSEELSNQIKEMRDLGRTPEDFGLMVRRHPETLAITAKKGVAEAKSLVISLAGRRIETTKLPASNVILRGNESAVLEFFAGIDDGSGWSTGSGFLGKEGIARSKVADLLAAFKYDRGNLILANSLHKIIREQAGPAFQDWTVGVVGGSGTEVELAPGLTVKRPIRAVRYASDGSTGAFRISGTSARLAGSTDLGKSYAHTGEDLVEPAVYAVLPHPVLLVYPLQPNLEVSAKDDTDHATSIAAAETQTAKDAWAKAATGSVTSLMALKIAIPGEPGAGGGDVEYLLNGPAIAEFRQDFTVSDDDLEDLDE